MRVRFRWLGSAGVLLGFAALGLHAFEAHADGMYCGSRLISTGDTLYRVRSVCGEPDDAQQHVETRVERHRIRVPCVANGPRHGAQCEQVVDVTVNVIVDEWTYDQGSQRLIKYLTFFDGRLGRLQTGGYGSDER
jgi:hypothetical protein